MHGSQCSFLSSEADLVVEINKKYNDKMKYPYTIQEENEIDHSIYI